MAAAYDGSIRINTKIDTDGATTGIATLTSGLKKMAATLGVAFSVQKVVEFGKASIDAASDINEVQNVVDTTFGSMSGDIDNFAKTATEKYGLSTLAAKQYTGTMGAMLKSMGLSTTSAADMSKEIAGLSGDLASFYNLDTETAFEKIRSGLSGETEPLKQLGINLSEANLSAYALSQGMTTAYSSMSEQQKVLVRYNYLLSVTSDAQGDFAKTSNSWANQVRILQLNFQNLEATLGKAFIASLTPVLQFLNQLISDLTYAASVFTDFIYTLTGTSDAANSTAAAVSNLSGTTNNSTGSTGKNTAATGKNTSAKAANSDATKEAANNLASFDKINTLSTSSTKAATPSSSGGDGGALGIGGLTSAAGAPSGGSGDTITSKVKSSLSGLLAILTASTGLLVIGAILAFSGHPIIGIALMAAGAIGIIAEAVVNWGTIQKALQGPIGEITALVSGALLALGAILAFSGANIPLGIGLMIAGAIGLATTITANWNSMDSSIAGELATILGLVAGAFLVLGIMLCFLGANVGLGIALIAIGAVSLAAAIAVDWNSTSNQVATTISLIAGIVSGALLAIGAIMVLTGGSLPLGIGLMVAGAVSLATTVAVNWNSTSTQMSQTISIITALVSAALLVIGAVLVFGAGSTPLGIGLMAAGAVGLASTVAVNWDNIQSALQGPIGVVTALVSAALLALGAVLAFSGGALPLGIGLMAAGAAGLAATVAVNWENIIEALQGPIGEVTAAIGGALLALGALLAFSGVALPLGIAIMALGAVSLATVVAVNWNTIVTALQGPIGAITAAASAALLALGVILCLSGVGIPLGIGLILAGAAGLAAVVAINWDYIPDKVAGIWTKIKDGTKNFINWMVGGIEWMVNKVLDGINWMIDQLNKISFSVPDWVPKIGGNSFGVNISNVAPVSLPRLAQGAVIPPNRQFMAVLGDQKNGMNIETPLDTMVHAFKTALSDTETQNNVPQTIQIVASGDDAGLIKFIKFSLDKESSRVGTKLITGGGRY